MANGDGMARLKAAAKARPQGDPREAHEAASKVAEWTTPARLVSARPAPLDPACLPKVFANWATELATALEVDQSMTVLAALATISMGLLAKAKIVLRSEPDDSGKPWTQPPNLYCAPVAHPSERKTPVYEAAIEPLLAREEKLLKTHAEDLELRTEEVKTAEARQGELRRRLSKADDAAERSKLKVELDLASLEVVAARKRVPKDVKLLISDVHPQTLARFLADVGGACGVATDEGDGPFSLLKKSDDGDEGAHFGVWLTGYDGSWGRTKRKDVMFSGSPNLAAQVFCQEQVLRSLGRGPAAHGLGFTARWLYGCCERMAGRRTNATGLMKKSTQAAFNDAVTRLLEIPVLPHSEALLYLDDDAQALFDSYRDEVEKLQDESTPMGAVAASSQWLGKQAGRVGRIALCLHAASRAFEERPLIGRVSAETMKAAIALGRATTEHAAYAFGVMSSSTTTDSAVAVLKWLASHPTKVTQPATASASFMVRDLLAGTHRQFKEGRADLDPVLRVLVDFSWLKLDQPGLRLESTQVFRVNPALWTNPELYRADGLPTQASANKAGATGTQHLVKQALPNSAYVLTPSGPERACEECQTAPALADGTRCEPCQQVANEEVRQ